MHRFYIPLNEWNSDALVLRGSEAHHARNVLRLQPGEKAVVFNGRGREITAEVTGLSAREVTLRRLHENTTPPLRCRITLGQAIPKGTARPRSRSSMRSSAPWISGQVS